MDVMEGNRIKFCFLLLVCLKCGCFAVKNVKTYIFPTDTCAPDPYLIDEETRVYLSFNGYFGSPDCRRVSFQTPDNPFYIYRICTKLLYFESSHCQSKLQFKSVNEQDYYSYGEIVELISEGCKIPEMYPNHDLDRCENSWISTVDLKLSKNKKEDDKYNLHNNYNHKRPTNNVPDKVNDTFKFQIDVMAEYNYELIGGLSGGLVGLVVLIVSGIFLCKCLRRRKLLNGKYCSGPLFTPGRLDGIKDGLSEGFSTECAFAGITLCACVLCRRQAKVPTEMYKITEGDVKNETKSSKYCESKYEKLFGLKEPDTTPLLSDN